MSDEKIENINYPFIKLDINGTYQIFLEEGIVIYPKNASSMKRILKNKKVEIKFNKSPVLSAEVID